MNLDWTCFTFKQIRAALFLGANLAISILPHRSPSALSLHGGEREMRGRATEGGVSMICRQRAEQRRGRGGGGGQLWHTAQKKVNGSEDLRCYGNDNKVETKRRGRRGRWDQRRIKDRKTQEEEDTKMAWDSFPLHHTNWQPSWLENYSSVQTGSHLLNMDECLCSTLVSNGALQRGCSSLWWAWIGFHVAA